MKRILIVRLSALGDIIHALPVLFAIKRALPSTTVDWLVEDNYASILALVPELDRPIIVRAKSPGGVDDAIRFGGGGIDYVRAVSFLRAQRYDAALDLQGLIKSAVWARASGAQRRHGRHRVYEVPERTEPHDQQVHWLDGGVPCTPPPLIRASRSRVE